MQPPVDGSLPVLLTVSDPTKASTPEAMALLTREGLRVVMATGTDVAMSSAQVTLVEDDLRGTAEVRA